MKPRLLRCLALILGGGLTSHSQINQTENPVVPAPAMLQCREAAVKDLGAWDDELRFADQDSIVLRRENSLFSYSLVTGRLKEIHFTNNLAGVRMLHGMTWETHQWVFCQSETAMPFAMDLAAGKTATFEIPGVSVRGLNGPNIHAIINSAVGPAAIVAITGDEATGWPRDGNSPLYYWMNLESGEVKLFPVGWDLDYFSADQKRAVFETISTDAWRYRPWVTVDMATGGVTGELPDQTKGLWSSMSGLWQTSFYPWENLDHRQEVRVLRSPQTEIKLLPPQAGRGHADDTFAGLSVKGIAYPLTVPGIGVRASCLDAKVSGNLAVFSIANDGHTKEWLWAAWLGRNEPPRLLATNSYDFEMLGDHRCALLVRNPYKLLVYDATSNCFWNIGDGVSPKTNVVAGGHANTLGTGFLHIESGAGPMTTCRLIPGFGSRRYPAKVLCLCSTSGIVPDNMIPPPVRKAQILLTDRGLRYEIHLPPELRDLYLDHSWLHNSGKLVINDSGHFYEADLRSD